MIRKLYSSICKYLLPLWCLELLYKIRCKLFYFMTWKEISRYKKANPQFCVKYERELEYIAAHKEVDLFNYNWKSQLSAKNIKVYSDKKKKMRYVLVEGNKKLYYPRRWTSSWIRFVHNALLKEALPKSPHRYFETGFCPSQEDVLLDIGSAEGIVALQYIEKVKKAILFETQEEWMEALQATFEPYKNKVRIVNKFVSDTNTEDTVTLDAYGRKLLDEDESFFIKCDIEGNEMSFLRGASDFLCSAKKLKLVICAYHKISDEADIKAYFEKLGFFRMKVSDNYMVYPPYMSKEFKPPYFRRGVIKILKKY